MAFKPGICPACHTVVDLPEEAETAFCPACGTSLNVADALTAYEKAAEDGTLPQPDIPVAIPVLPPQQPAAPSQPAEIKSASEERLQSLFGKDSPIQKEQDTEFLRQWKTDGLFTVLGVALRIVGAWTLLDAVGFSLDDPTATAAMVLCGIELVSSGVASGMVPKRFMKDFKRTNYMVSFWNGLIGGAIFGPYWNSRLTQRRMGWSHLVFCILAFSAAMAYLPLLMA